MQHLRSNRKLTLEAQAMAPSHGSPSSAFQLLQTRERQRMAIARTPSHPGHSFYSVALSQRNRHGNRYSDILAYDRTAVGGEQGYLNANVVIGPDGGWWVAAQAPIPSSIHPFLHALANRSAAAHSSLAHLKLPESDRAIIVQLTGLVERGIQKADPYLPTSVDSAKTYAPPPTAPTHPTYKLSLCSPPVEQESIGSTCTTLDLESNKASPPPLKIHHYLYHAWPDHGVPSGQDVERLRNLVYEIDRIRKEYVGAEVWVHCSAGVGRTGTFIALASLLTPATSGPSPLPPSPLGPLPTEAAKDIVLRTVDVTRESRGMLVQTVEQLGLIYDIVEQSPPIAS